MSAQVPVARGPSILPTVRAESRPGGIALMRPAGGDQIWVLPLIGGVFVLLGGGITTATFRTGSMLFQTGSMFATFAMIFVIVGLGLLGLFGWRLYQRATLGDAEVLFPRMPLRLGEPMTIKFRQVRHRSRAHVQGISARITCVEWVRYTQGTDTRTAQETLWSAELPQAVNDPMGAAEVLAGSFQLYLPPELPPSFVASNNAVRWSLAIDIDIKGRPDLAHAFALPVVPEVIRDLR